MDNSGGRLFKRNGTEHQFILSQLLFKFYNSETFVTMKMMKIVASLFALILLVNLVESQGGYDCYSIYRESDRTCHRGFNHKSTAAECCQIGAEAVGANGVNGHCVPCWNV